MADLNLTKEQIKRLYLEKHWEMELIAETIHVPLADFSRIVWNEGWAEQRNSIEGLKLVKSYNQADIDDVLGLSSEISIEKDFFG